VFRFTGYWKIKEIFSVGCNILYHFKVDLKDVFGSFGEKMQISLTLVILGKSFCISGFVYELILNRVSTVTYTFFAFLD